MGVEQPQLLAAINGIERVIDVERDPLGNLAKRRAIEIDHGRPIRSSARASGRFSKREIVDCEHGSRSDGVRSIAILNAGSPRRCEASLPSS